MSTDPLMKIIMERARCLICGTTKTTEEIAMELGCSMKQLYRASKLVRDSGDVQFQRCLNFRRGGVARMKNTIMELNAEGLHVEGIADRLFMPEELIRYVIAEHEVPPETFGELWGDWVCEEQNEARLLEWTTDGIVNGVE